MDDLQYANNYMELTKEEESFKPCYKWMTFNTVITTLLGITGFSFKPCYKWMTFNTFGTILLGTTCLKVLNLVING